MMYLLILFSITVSIRSPHPQIPPKKTPLFESRTARCMPWLQVQESPGSETPSRK